MPEKLVGDKADDSDALDEKLLQKYNIELIAPHRRGRKNQKLRMLRRYQRRWKVERLFAWLQRACDSDRAALRSETALLRKT
jgi:hypothetical protein